MRVLVTGARGFLGSTLTPHLRALGHDVLSHARSGDVDLTGDLSHKQEARALLHRAAPDVIVNLAALTDVDQCERDPKGAYRANVHIVEQIAVWMRDSGASTHLVQLSTDQVYDGPGPHAEDEVAPSNYYGLSKFAGELVAATVPSTILRTNFVGPSGHAGRLGLSDWLVRALTCGTPITVFEDICFSPLTLQRVVGLIGEVVARPVRGLFNLGSKDGMSKADLAFAIADLLELPTTNVTRGTTTGARLGAYRPKDMRMDSSRFEKAYGVTLPTLREEVSSLKAIYGTYTK